MADSAALANLAAEAYTVLRRRIVGGEIPLGQAISRRQVAAELGMSFLPVTSAMLRLEYEGLVESRPRAGTRVCVPTREQVEGQHVVRVALETHAAMLFPATATDSERHELRRRAAQLDACDAWEAPPYASLHAEFHGAIAMGTHCAALVDALGQVNGLALTWSSAFGAASRTQSNGEHGALAETLVQGTPDDARKAMRAHLDGELDSLRVLLGPHSRLIWKRDSGFHRAPRRIRRLPAASGF